ncbi:hypothetical protein PVK06_039745 [Gossypium arboreum]|uniref:Uncharacterized protein n=1 Tax=Gossypium arboreum TaxID=29729 RepID=A0ABR0N3P3_GOSAR|nr:hypothetical protein PVK06_039745 [Gossypium arboreum]
MDDTIPIEAPGAKEAGEEVEVLAFGVINTLSRAQRVCTSKNLHVELGFLNSFLVSINKRKVDLTVNFAAENVDVGSFASNGAVGTTSVGGRPVYVPPHLRNHPPSANPPAPISSGLTLSNDRPRYDKSPWTALRDDYNNRLGYDNGSGGSRIGGWSGRIGGRSCIGREAKFIWK